MSENPNFRLRPSSKQLSQRREQLRSGSNTVLNESPSLERQLHSLQTNGRLNELESALINFKNNVDVRLSRMSDPRTEFKAMVDKQSNLNRQLAMKVNQLEEALYHTQESMRKNDEIVSATLLEFQKRLEVTEYRARTNEKELEGVTNLRVLAQAALPAPPISEPSGSASELRLLREMFSQEKKSRETNEQSMFRQYQSLIEKHSQLEKEMYTLLNEQQKEQQKLLAANKQSEELHLRAKNQQQGSELSAVRGLIGSVERKLEGEIHTKLRSEGQLKQYIDGRTERIRQELMMEQKAVLNSQTNFMKESKESIESLYTLVMTGRQQWEQNLSATQSLTADNIKSTSKLRVDLSKSIDVVRDTLTKKLEGFLSTNHESGNKYGELRAKVIESLKAVQERLRQIQERSQQSEDKLERQNGAAFEQILKKIEDEQLMTNNWKTDVERKNLTIFKEISGTLRILKSQLSKQKQESIARDLTRQKEFEAHQKNLSGELKKYIEGIITVFNNQFEVVVGELEILVEMINMSRTESEKVQAQRLEQQSEKLREEMLTLTNNKIHELAGTIEKNISKASQQMITRLLKESTYLNDLIAQKESTLSTQVSILSSEVKQSQLRTEAEQSAAREKYQQFVGQYKDAFAQLQLAQAKLRNKLEEQVRSSTTSALEVANKRNEFVIEGIRKAMELNAQKDKTEVRGLIDQARTESTRAVNNLKYQLASDFNEKMETERSERIDQQQHLSETLQAMDSNLRQSLAIETSSLKVYVEEQLKATSNKLQQYNIELTGKVATVREDFEQAVTRIDTQRYVDGLERTVIFGELQHQQQQFGQQLQLHTEELEKLKKLPEELDAVQQQFYEFDEKLTKLVEATSDRLTNMLYLDRNFTKVQLDDHEKTLVQILEIVEQVNSRTEANTEDIEDTDTRFTDNFRVMEKAIKHTNEFLSVLDSRLTIEELYAKVSEQQLWEQLVKLTDQQSEAHPPELPQS